MKKTKPISILPKWPRHYALEIINESSKDKRRLMLSMVPDELRALTKEHVKNHFALMPYR